MNSTVDRVRVRWTSLVLLRDSNRPVVIRVTENVCVGH